MRPPVFNFMKEYVGATARGGSMWFNFRELTMKEYVGTTLRGGSMWFNFREYYSIYLSLPPCQNLGAEKPTEAAAVWR
jgi:hypothetical protein